MNIPQGDRVARDNHRVSISRRSVNKVSQGCRRRSGVFHYGQGLRVLETSSATGFAAMKGEMKRVQKRRKRQVWNAAEPRWRGAVRTRQTDAVVEMSGELSNFLTGSHPLKRHRKDTGSSCSYSAPVSLISPQTHLASNPNGH